jgi:hypothetical protein
MRNSIYSPASSRNSKDTKGVRQMAVAIEWLHNVAAIDSIHISSALTTK